MKANKIASENLFEDREQLRSSSFFESSFTDSVFETPYAPKERYYLDQALKTFEILEDDWNGFGAIAPRKEAIRSAVNFINKFPFDRLYPTNVSLDDGDVVMTWKDDAEVIELIIEPALIHLYKKTPNRKTEYVENEIFDGQKIPQRILSYIPQRKQTRQEVNDYISNSR